MVPRVVTAASLSLLPWPLPMAAATVATVATGMTAVPVSVPPSRSAPAQPTVATVTMAVMAAPVAPASAPAWPLLVELTPATTAQRSEEHTSELQSLMRISYAVFCLKKKTNQQTHKLHNNEQM